MPQLLLADADPLGALGGSGWVGAGLLGLVVAWLLLIHIPARDKNDREAREAHSALIRAIIDKNAEERSADADRCESRSTAQRADYKETLASIVAPLARAVDGLCSAVDRMERKS